MTVKIRNIIIGIAVLAYFPILFAFVSVSKNEVVCSGIHVVVADSAEASFVNSYEIKLLLQNKFPYLLGGKIDDVNCEGIEDFMKQHTAIDGCEAYCTIGGQLNVNISQRKPLVRVFSGLDSYYIDVKGEKMPLSTKHAAHVLVLSGHVNKLDSLNKVIDFARFIRNNEFWDAQIEQIYVEDNGEFSLAPRVGDQIIYLGTLNNYPTKMRNLYAFYTKGIHPKEWNNYKEINLKYEGQIICTKR